MNKKSLMTWLLAIALGGGLFAVKTMTEIDADKAKRTQSVSSAMNRLTINLDNTGTVAETHALGAFYTYCRANIGPTDSGAAFSDDEKKTYCGCAMVGMQKLYYGKLSVAELAEISKRSPITDMGPEDTQQQVLSACASSRDAYR